MATYTKIPGPSPQRRTWTQYGKLCLLLILSTLISSVSFSQIDFRQSANNDAGYTQGDVHWLNSILQQSNSTYVEGMSSLQRIILLNVESKASHTITFSHQSIKSSAGAHAYDFITSWAQAKAVSNRIGSTSFNPALTLFGNLNECGAEPGSDPTGYLTACQTAHSSNGGTNYFDAILDDNMADGSLGGTVKDRIAAYEALAKSINPALEQRSIRVWGNAPVTNATVTFTGYTGGDQDANYSLTWNSTATTIVIEFATHLAVGRDPFKTSTRDIGYGAGKGAGGISGGPYHVNLYQLDGASLGSQDNQIKAADVLIPPSCTVSGPTIICAEEGQKTYTSIVTDPGTSPTYSWVFVPTPNTVNAEFYNNTNLTASATIQPVGGPAAGDYLPGTFNLQMTVTTQGGLSATCQLPSAVTVYKVTASESHTSISCYGGTSTATITATGGTAPYTFTLNSVTNTTGVFPGLAAGSYTATVTDANGCAGSVAVNITQPPQLTCAIPEGAPVLCNGQSNGSATVVAVGGTAPYSYLWDNGETTAKATALNAGTHTVTVTDANGCTTSCQVEISQPSAVSVSASAGVVACNGGTATITVTGSGGTPPYTYSLDGVTYGSSNTFTRGAGSYTAYVKDANGCIASTPVEVTQPSTLDASIAATPILCYGGNTTITVTGTGGTPPYTYSLDGVTYGSTNTFTRTAGSYTGYVKDAKGCIDNAPITVTQPTQLVASIAATPILCYGGNTTITVSATGGTAPYTYSLDGVTYGSTNTFTRTAGSYTGYVKDANGCIDNEPITVTQPTQLVANATAGSVSCNGGTTTITVTATGGTAPYTYSLDGVTYGSTNTFTRGAGSYTAYVKDANGCIDDAPVTVSQPSTVDVSAAFTPILCYGGNTTITLTGSGGTAPYTYSLDGVTYGSSNTFTRPAGSYTGYVKDANGCIDNTPITVGQPTAVVAAAASTPILCNGGNTTITVTATGGTPPYTYSLDGVTYGSTNTFTRTAGSYTAYVKDANGCIDTEPITVGQPTVVVAAASSTPILCYGGNTTITVTGSGGTPPYTYSLDGVTYGSTNTFTRTAGSYTAYVKDANGCIDDQPITVGQPTLLTCTAALVKSADCGKSNGSATVTPSGGTSPYTYLWDNGETTQTATALAPGTHSVTVTDNNGCTTTCNVDVPELPCAITLCTYTQGAYGNAGGKYCTAAGQMTTTQLINYSLTNWGGQLYLGRPGQSFSITSSQVSALIGILPGGGQSTALPLGNWMPSNYPILKNGRLTNTLLAQTITLGLNLGVIPGANGLGNAVLESGENLVTAKPAGGCSNISSGAYVNCTFQGYKLVSSGVIQFLYDHMWNGSGFVADGSSDKKATIMELFQLASSALGGNAYGQSLGAIASLEDQINNIFDGCRVNLGYMTDTELYNLQLNNGCFLTTAPVAAVSEGSDLKISAYPNPYNNTVNFNFTSPVTGKALLEVYDLVGRRVAVVFEGNVDAGMQRNVNYKVSSAQRVPMIYKLSIGGKTSFGKLLPGTTD